MRRTLDELFIFLWVTQSILKNALVGDSHGLEIFVVDVKPSGDSFDRLNLKLLSRLKIDVKDTVTMKKL